MILKKLLSNSILINAKSDFSFTRKLVLVRMWREWDKRNCLTIDDLIFLSNFSFLFP